MIGGGPAGLTAAIFTSRAGLNTLLVTEDIGGLVLWTEEIENYPGLRKVSSRKLIGQMARQAKGFGTKIVKSTVRKIRGTKSGVELTTDDGRFEGKSLIVASGLKHRRLGVEGEDLPGVSYCAVCDGPLYEGMDVHVIGSGDSAMIDTIFLSKIAKSVNVIVIHEEPNLDASEYLRRRVLALRNIRFVWRSVVDKILGERAVEGVQVRDLKTGKSEKLQGDAVFIKVGLVPKTEFLEGFVELTKEGFVRVADERTLETSRDGVFAAGDVREKIQRQIATAVGDGSLVAESVFRYLEEQEYLGKMLESEKVMVVSFWNSSIPSSSQDALMGRLERELGQKVGVIKIDCYKRKSLAERFGIREVPSTLIVRRGKTLWKISGKIGPDELLERVKMFLSDPEDDPFHGKRGWTGVNEQNYQTEVIGSKKPVLVEFWGPKCKDCLEMAPAIQKLSEEFAEKIKFCHFKCPSRYAVLELGIRNLPTFYFYENGKMVKSLSKENARPEKIGEALEALGGSHP